LGKWKRKHLQIYVLEGLRRILIKPSNNSKLSLVTQGQEENFSTFLERLKGALIKRIY
jgi:hypothetical protein